MVVVASVSADSTMVFVVSEGGGSDESGVSLSEQAATISAVHKATKTN
jgi:hypothetical protein